jgi:hypothetical protein
MTVAKLKGARDRVRRRTGKCEGRKSYAERDANMVALAKEIKGQGGRVSLRDVAAALAAEGHTTPSGKPYSASAVASMLARVAGRAIPAHADRDTYGQTTRATTQHR